MRGDDPEAPISIENREQPSSSGSTCLLFSRSRVDEEDNDGHVGCVAVKEKTLPAIEAEDFEGQGGLG